MAANFQIMGGGNKRVAHVTQKHTAPEGLMVYTHPYDEFNYQVEYLTNGQFGREMAQDPTGISITSTLIHDGTDTAAWTASAVTGGGFTFNSTAQAYAGTRSVDATVSSNNDIASFAAPAPLNPTTFTLFRMYIYITGWDSRGTKDVTLQWYNGGAPTGIELSIKNYMDTATLNTWQQVDIPMSDFQLTATQIDDLQIRTVDIGRGSPPNYYLDDIQLISSTAGTGVYDFRWDVPYGTEYCLTGLRFTARTSGKTNLDSSEFFGLTSLTNGIELVYRNDEEVFAALDAREIFDMLSWGDVETHVEGSTNNVTIVVEFRIPLGHFCMSGTNGDFITVKVRDDLTSMDRFNCALTLARKSID